MIEGELQRSTQLRVTSLYHICYIIALGYGGRDPARSELY